MVGWFRMENPNLKWMIWGYPHDLGNFDLLEYPKWRKIMKIALNR